MRDVQPLIVAARALQLPVVVDPKGKDFEPYRGATVLTPNLSEFEAVVGPCASEDELVRRAESLRQHLNLHALLITRSEHGMTLVAEGQAPVHLPTQAREVFDVTGAGDTVAAIVGAGLAAGLTLIDAVALSNIGAGIVVGKLGTASVTADDLRAALHLNTAPHSASGICTEDGLVAQRQRARSQGETVVMTNGCFDILHPGQFAGAPPTDVVCPGLCGLGRAVFRRHAGTSHQPRPARHPGQGRRLPAGTDRRR